MKRLAVFSLMGLMAMPAISIAKDTILNLKLADVIALGKKEGKLDGSIQFF